MGREIAGGQETSALPSNHDRRTLRPTDERIETVSPENSKPSQDKLTALAQAVALIEREEGRGAMLDLSAGAVKVPTFSTGSLPLDIALGGGLPRGRVIEVFGPEASGKTTLCYHAIASMQRQGGIAAFIDAEHSMDTVYAQRCGVSLDPSQFLAAQPDYGEQALKIVEKLVVSGAVDLVVVDSVAALAPKAEIDGEIGDQFVGLQARMMSQAMRKLAAEAARNDCAILFTNQLREKIGVFFGSPETTPGGKALKFYASVRMDIRRIETLKDGKEAYGSRVRVKVVKNKVAAPWRQAEFDVRFNEGFDRYGALIDLGIETKEITKAGSFFSYGDIRLGQGRERARAYLIENPQLADELEAKVRAAKLGEDPSEVIGAQLAEDEREEPKAVVEPELEASVA
jgi:recombination protein RecA